MKRADFGRLGSRAEPLHRAGTRAIFSDAVQDELLDAMFQVLRQGGQFATFAYMHGLALPAGRKFREKLATRFRKLDRSPVVWRNTPPAVVYHGVR